ncbi:hypothetical protein QA644_33560 (plasmid) [Rhizobium sp. CC1099]|uniref:hypothetical protein n=1 Tax=Rhizobium sp. CC1099 TaxID=3039160 RepID=UPI0024B1A6C1|nr:hypothetical protein [Rhizobium sp. CC1099]WFU92264.1 hypothetical protein QA644_33560 [Rhizobium sp. CC1099]
MTWWDGKCLPLFKLELLGFLDDGAVRRAEVGIAHPKIVGIHINLLLVEINDNRRVCFQFFPTPEAHQSIRNVKLPDRQLFAAMIYTFLQIEVPFVCRGDYPGKNIFVGGAGDCQEFLKVIDFLAGVSKASGRVSKIAQRVDLIVKSFYLLRLQVLVQHIGSAEAHKRGIDHGSLESLCFVRTASDTADIFCKMQAIMFQPIGFRQAPNVGVVPLVVAELLLLQAKQVLCG